MDANQPVPPTNHYSKDELKRIRDAVKTYQRIKKEVQRHREDWLKVIGPVLIMVRDKAIELSGTTETNSQAYRDAIGEELKRTGLDTIDKSTRSYLLRIMDNLEEVQAWLAERINTDRLNHPKTIWKAFYQLGLRDDPGADHEDTEEYYGEEPDDREKVDCAKCGRKTADFVVRKDGSFFCDECHKANPEKDDDDAGDHDAGDGAGGDDDAGDHDHDKDGDDAGGDDADDKGDDDDAGDHDHDHDKGDDGKEVTALRKRISDLESKLATAVAERERLYSENAELKLIIEGLTKQIASPATAPDDNDEESDSAKGHTGHPPFSKIGQPHG